PFPPDVRTRHLRCSARNACSPSKTLLSLGLMKKILLSAFALFVTVSAIRAADSEDGFVSLMDGKTFSGWKIAEPNKKSWRIEDGCFVANGESSHLFYVGDDKPFKDFELKVDVMTGP